MTESLALVVVFLASTFAAATASLWAAMRLRRGRRRRPDLTVAEVRGELQAYGDWLPPSAAPTVRRDLYARAVASKQSGDYTAALRLLGELLAWDPTPAERALAHLEMGDCFAERGDLADGELHYREAHAISVAHALRTELGTALRKMSRMARVRGDVDSALALGTRALEAHREGGDAKEQAEDLRELGNAYFQRGELDKAEEHYKKALAIDEEIGKRLGQAQDLGNLGVVYFQRGELDKAEEHCRKALAIHQEIGNRLGQANALGNLGNIYARRRELAKAEEHHKRALAIDEEMGNRLGQAQDLCNLGIVYFQQGELDKAEEHFKKALAIFEEIGNRLGQANQLVSLGLLAAQRGDPDKARSLLNQAKALYQATGAGGEKPELIRAALELLDLADSASPPKSKPKRSRKKGPPKP